MSASNLHVYSEVGPAIEVIKWHEKPDYFFGVDAEAVPSSVLLRCASEAPVCWREDGMLWGVEAGRLVLGVDAEAVPSSVRDVTQRFE